MASASLKIINEVKNSKERQFGNIDYRPAFHIVNTKPVETTTQALSRLLFESGQLDRSAYDAVRGIQYDSDVENGNEDFYTDWNDDENDDFIQSAFAYYEEIKDDIQPAGPDDVEPVAKSESPAEAQASSESVEAPQAPAE